MSAFVDFFCRVLRLNPSRVASRGPSLCDLSNGADARVVGIDLPAPVRQRLLELGFLPGTRLRAVRRAPLGDPLEIEVRGYRLSLRCREAKGIRVEEGV